MKNINKKIRKDKVKELIKLVKLNGYENKYPSELSGGQKTKGCYSKNTSNKSKGIIIR